MTAIVSTAVPVEAMPRTLSTMEHASADAAAEDAPSRCISCFEHRHLADDTERQVGELRKLSRKREAGFFYHELESLSRVLALAGARLRELAGSEGADLATIVCVLVALCTRPFKAGLSSDESRFGRDATRVFASVGELPAAREQTVFTAAADALESTRIRPFFSRCGRAPMTPSRRRCRSCSRRSTRAWPCRRCARCTRSARLLLDHLLSLRPSSRRVCDASDFDSSTITGAFPL